MQWMTESSAKGIRNSWQCAGKWYFRGLLVVGITVDENAMTVRDDTVSGPSDMAVRHKGNTTVESR